MANQLRSIPQAYQTKLNLLIVGAALESGPPPQWGTPLNLPHAQGNPGPLTLSWCGGPNGSANKPEKSVPAARGVSAHGAQGGPGHLRLPDDAGPTTCGPMLA